MVPLTNLILTKVFTGNFNYVLLIAIVLLLVMSAFFSSCETAFTTSNHIRIKNYADDKVKGARRALYIVENFDKTITTILVGNNFVNICSTTICAYMFSIMFVNPTLANLLNTIIMTIIVLIFGEILPKSLAKINPEKLALRFSRVLYVFMIVLSPFTWLFLKIQRLFTKQIKVESVPTVTEDELESIIDTMEEEGVIDSENADMIQNALSIIDTAVYDIMTPRVDMITAEIENSEENIEAIRNLFLEYQYSRMPICDGDKDHVIGILNQKDFFMAVLKNEPINISLMITTPVYVSEKLKVDELIRTMQKTKKHMAIVLDEYGGTSGLVTMEDALEEMVGEIYDEHDDEENSVLIRKLDNGSYEVDAEIPVEDLFEYLEIEHLPETSYSSLGGFLYELCQNIPEKNMIIHFNTVDERLDKSNNYVEKVVDMTFKLIDIEDRRIRKVILTVKDSTVEDNAKAE